MEEKDNLVMGPMAIKTFIDKRMAPAMAELGLTAGSGKFIFFIHKHEGASMKDISECLCVNKALTTRMVSSLIEDGFVINEGAGHEYKLRLSDKGIEVYDVAVASFNEAWGYLLKDVSKDE